MKKHEVITVDGVEYLSPTKEYIEERKKIKYEYLLKKSGIPSFYWDVEFSDYQGEISLHQKKQVEHYAKNLLNPEYKDVNLYLYGVQKGCQKTALACNVGKEAIRQGLNVVFVLFGKFIHLVLKNQGFNEFEETKELLSKMKSSDIIVLDDSFDREKALLWKNKESNAVIIQEIDLLLRDLVYNGKRFIITSNVPVIGSDDSVENNYGKSLFELIDRNFLQLEFKDSVKEKRKSRFDNLFKDMED